MKTAEELKQAVKEHAIKEWHVHDCSFCGYPCGYRFPGGNTIVYDSGCDCISGYSALASRTWEEVTAFYNAQTNPVVIHDMEEAFHFEHSTIEIPITMKSTLSNKIRTVKYKMTTEQYVKYLQSNDTIQSIFPEYTKEQREFLVSGITAEEWDNAFKDEDNE